MENEQLPSDIPSWRDDDRNQRPDYTGPIAGGALVMLAVAVIVCLHRPAAIVAAAPTEQAGAATTVAQTTGYVVFEPSYEAAIAAAKAQQKPLLIDFYTDWCGHCKEVDAQYGNPAVISALGNALVVKVNAEQRTDLAATYHVDGYPYLVTVDSNGNVISNIAGAYASADDFASWLRSNLRA